MAIYFKSFRTWLFIGYIALIIYVTLSSGDDLIWFSKLWRYDKIVHFVEYLGVGFLIINMLMIRPIKRKHLQFVFLFLLLFPLFDESLQYFIPKRIPDIFDALCDICGGFAGAYIRKIL